MNWFLTLPPGEQITIVMMVASSIFNAGVFWATVRYLRAQVKEVKETTQRHEEELQQHGEEIAALQERTHR